MNAQSIPRSLSYFKPFAQAASATVIVIGFLVLGGWAIDSAIFISVFPTLVAMNPITAVAFILAGLSLWLLGDEATDPSGIRRGRRFGQACALAVALVGLLRLSEILLGWNLGVDQLLFHQKLAAAPAGWPNHMAPNTALNFLLVGFALLFLNVETRRRRRPAQFLVLASALIALLAVVGYAYGVTYLYGLPSFIPMALNTALAFLVLSLGILCARPSRGVMTLFTSESAGGNVARRLLPAAIIVPLLLGWLRWEGERARLYGTSFGIALFTTAMIVALALLIWRSAIFLDRADKERQRVEEELNRFFMLSLDMLCIAGFDGYFKRLNPAWEKTLGLTREELLAKPYIEFVHPEDREATIAEAAKLTTGADTISFENRYLCKDGSYKWLLWSSTPSVAQQLLYATARDITDRKRAEEVLAQAKEEAERVSRFKDQFLSTMSHELRTPLNAVLGFAELLADERYGSLNERQRRYASHIREGGQHLLRLINDILDLSRIEAGRLELAFEDVPVQSAFAEVLSGLRPLADKKSQTLSQQVEAGLAVRADATRFKQMLMNLVGNAIKFTPEGGCIDLTARSGDGQARVEVRDTGPGIPPEEQKRIFEAFYQLRHGGKATQGTGLGLAITERLVELHDGKLGLESQPGQGSCFYLTLPVAARVREPRTRETRARERTTQAPTILVIDDDPAATQLFESQLTSAGYEALVCTQPERAVELAAKLQPQAITLDLLMKPTNGWEVLLGLKNDPRTSSIPIVVVTIVDQPAMGAILGADEYLVKPVDKQALLAAIERCLAARAASPAARPILVVEDDARTREVISELLTAAGYPVVTLGDAAQTRAWMAASLPALVILDLLLPEVSGFELLAEWRASPRTADLPVFVLTGKDLSVEEEKYLRDHVESLFRKQQPWQEALLKQLQRVVTYSQPEKV